MSPNTIQPRADCKQQGVTGASHDVHSGRLASFFSSLRVELGTLSERQSDMGSEMV